jgi:phosphatidylinositol alpha 1,6-mannosyltransferase
MRVLISAESFLPRSNGVTNTVVRTAKFLKEHGHHVLVIAPGDGPDNVNGHPILRMPAISLHSPVAVDIATVTTTQLRKVLRSFNPDVVHLASPYLLGAQVRKAAGYLGIPTVAVYQTDVTGFSSFYGLNFVRALADKRLQKIHMRSDVNLAPSKSAQRYLQSLGVPHVEIWSRGVDHSNFNPRLRSGSLRRSWGVKSGDIVIGFVGRLAPEKQVENLRALRGIGSYFERRIHTVIIGDGPSRKRLESELPEAIFTGHLSDVSLGTAMASLDLLVTTGEHETFCQVIQEGMASAIPVVAPASGGPLDLVEEGVTGHLYPPGDLAGLRRAVLAVLVNPEKSRAMGEMARLRVAGRSWDRVCQEILHHYERAIESHRGRWSA